MKNTFGSSVSCTIFGESHGEEIGAVLDGMAPGVPVDPSRIAWELTKRRPGGSVSTARTERDAYRIVSGVKDGKTTGTPITILIPNRDVRSCDYADMQALPRPGHADYTAELKYHGYQDARGGGHFSGRITAALVAVGAIARTALSGCGITVGTHISRLHGIPDREFADLTQDLAYLDRACFPVLSAEAGAAMEAEILRVSKEGDSVGGILETVVTGFPGGVGEPFFDSLESVLAHGLFSIPGIKGVEFGLGFGFADVTGSVGNDPMRIQNGVVTTVGNHNGGINGGISVGAPLSFRVAVKPTPSIAKVQETVNLATMENATLSVGGRHDPAIVHRVRAVVDSVTALTLCDQLALRYGTDFLKGAAK